MNQLLKVCDVDGRQRYAGEEAIGMFVDNVGGLMNGAIEQVGEYLAKQSPAARARFIERCSSLIGTAAEIGATK